MTVHVPVRPATPEMLSSGPPVTTGPAASGPAHGSSPQAGERLRPLTRRQIEDRFAELGDLYAQTSGGGPRAWNAARGAFLRQLGADVRRPGFCLLIAETTVLTGCAYGYPVPGGDPRGGGLEPYLPGTVLSVAASGRLFLVSGIVVPARVRRQHQDGAWNLARRMQTRLLAEHDAALGITLVDRTDGATVQALRSWGWRYAQGETLQSSVLGRYGVLVLGR
ncbi:GNAT family N-acetyltransferase OS=Streptomyces tendae OX=1932 GN=GUR47_20370 PE=4 SV=1 [Streptomyces tendae]